jgi:hypothetical protein
MNRTYVAALALALAGCAAQLTQGGTRVRQVQPDWASRCDFLGVVEAGEGNGMSVSDDQLGAMNALRNRVADMGGNAFAITQSTSNMMRTVVQGDAYRCP